MDNIGIEECIICKKIYDGENKGNCINKKLIKKCKCKYDYHNECINSWLDKNKKCVICDEYMNILFKESKWYGMHDNEGNIVEEEAVFYHDDKDVYYFTKILSFHKHGVNMSYL